MQQTVSWKQTLKPNIAPLMAADVIRGASTRRLFSGDHFAERWNAMCQLLILYDSEQELL